MEESELYIKSNLIRERNLNMNPYLHPLPPGSVRLSGPCGDTLDKIIKNRLLPLEMGHLTEPFRLRNEEDYLWRCEFWGKIVRSMILAWRSTGNAELLAKIRLAVKDILSTQTPDGCISSYPADKQLEGWDIWGRKYVMLGLLRYLRDVERDEKVETALCRLADHLIAQIGEREIKTFGYHGGLAASSIINAFVQLYEVSRIRRYLEFAEKIIRGGCSTRHNIFEAAENLTPPSEIGNAKAYEMMSCFEGLAEYNQAAETPLYPAAVSRFYRLLHYHELMIHGTMGARDCYGELDYDCRFKQTRTDSGMLGETCVTATWLHYCEHQLMFDGNVMAANDAEITFLNAAIGSARYDGAWFCHINPSPLSAFSPKIPAYEQQTGYGEDCCVAQGPEAAAMAPYLAVMASPDGYAVNLYEPMEVRDLLKITGSYPYGPEAKITLKIPAPAKFELKLRIPEWWNDRCSLKVCGKECPAVPGSWCSCSREWHPDDVIDLHFDLSVRRIEAPGDPSSEAYMSGSIVLAESSRLPQSRHPLPDDAEFTDLPPHDGFRCLKAVSGGGILGDYASAGNLFRADDLLQVWFPRTPPYHTPYRRGFENPPQLKS